MRGKATFLLLIGLCITEMAHAQTGDAGAGERKSTMCAGCHGITGWRNAYPAYSVPKLGGQHAEYLVAALNAYKAGQRSHPTMQAIAATLNDQDMADLAAYFSQTKDRQ